MFILLYHVYSTISSKQPSNTLSTASHPTIVPFHRGRGAGPLCTRECSRNVPRMEFCTILSGSIWRSRNRSQFDLPVTKIYTIMAQKMYHYYMEFLYGFRGSIRGSKTSHNLIYRSQKKYSMFVQKKVAYLQLQITIFI
jgi:hypothetical protein